MTNNKNWRGNYRVLSPKFVYNQNEEEIKNLLDRVAKLNNVKIKDAAYTLEIVFKGLIGKIDKNG